MKVLVVGGTGPSGPHLLRVLLEKGHDVTILHRGVHEPPGLPDVPHIHADPHFSAPLLEAIRGKSFDAVFGLYGRLKVLAEVFAGRTDRFIAVGGRPVYAGFFDPSSTYPRGMQVLATEDSPRVDPSKIKDPAAAAFAGKLAAAEEAVMSRHREGAYRATLFRYPYVYGPRAPGPFEWSVVRRVRDGRNTINLPAGGLVLNSRCAARNAAHFLMLALDSESACGEIFNCADDVQYSLGQWVELIAGCMGAQLEIVDVPAALRWTVGNFLIFAGTASDIVINDISKAKRLLGYKDVVRPMDALAETVEWYRHHPHGWENAMTFQDKFDYALEDRVRDALNRLKDEFAALDPQHQAVHPYAHPKQPSSLAGDEKGR